MIYTNETYDIFKNRAKSFFFGKTTFGRFEQMALVKKNSDYHSSRVSTAFSHCNVENCVAQHDLHRRSTENQHLKWKVGGTAR